MTCSPYRNTSSFRTRTSSYRDRTAFTPPPRRPISPAPRDTSGKRVRHAVAAAASHHRGEGVVDSGLDERRSHHRHVRHGLGRGRVQDYRRAFPRAGTHKRRIPRRHHRTLDARYAELRGQVRLLQRRGVRAEADAEAASTDLDRRRRRRGAETRRPLRVRVVAVPHQAWRCSGQARLHQIAADLQKRAVRSAVTPRARR